MTLSLQDIAEKLHTAQASATETSQLEEEISIDSAYEVQRLILDRRLAQGETYIGPKLGFTSKAKMEQMGVHNIIVGFLTDAMDHDPSEELSLKDLIHPRIEPELVFELGSAVEPVVGESVEELAERIRSAVRKVAVGMEVIDSRYKDFKFNLADVVSDNTSAARFVVGQYQDFPRELAGLKVEFLINGEVVDSADTNAILGDPNEAFLELAKMIQKYGFHLPAGATILGGSMTAAQWLEAGQVIEARVETFEPLTLKVAG